MTETDRKMKPTAADRTVAHSELLGPKVQEGARVALGSGAALLGIQACVEHAFLGPCR